MFARAASCLPAGQSVLNESILKYDEALVGAIDSLHEVRD